MAATMIALLGGKTSGPVAFSNDEVRRLRKLYGYTVEKPRQKPPPPEPPRREDFEKPCQYEDALRKHKEALNIHAKWTDPRPIYQAGADINMFKHAEADGLRLLAWLARYVEPGQDPLRVLVQMAITAGYDVDPSDIAWAEDETDEDGSEQAAQAGA